MNEAFRITQLERIQQNMFLSGVVETYDDENNQVTVRVNPGTAEEMLSASLPMMGRISAQIGEPVILALPGGTPGYGYALPILPDPRINELETRLDTLENV